MHAAERARAEIAQARVSWHTDAQAGLGGIAPERVVFIDECGVLTTLTRLYGGAPRGQRAVVRVPLGHKQRLSVVGALGRQGMLASLGLQGAVTAASFVTYLESVLFPQLRLWQPDAVLVMDNLPAHKTARVRAVNRTGFAGGFTS